MRAIGLMSGTSLDGVDVALLDTDGETIAAFGPLGYRPYADAERALLREALAAAAALSERTARPGVLAAAERLVTAANAEAVEQLLTAHGLAPAAIDVVGFHGQTVLHRPERRLTVQIGDGAALARRLGIAVVHDLRAADVAAGGQGAPLVPVYHQALARRVGLAPPLAVLNLGGVGNVTFIGRDGAFVAFDTGPGNALVDDLVRARTGAAFDRDGALARAGRVDQNVLDGLLADGYFAKLPPKSLDRDDFRRQAAAVAGLATEDAAATLTAFTAGAVACAEVLLPELPALWVVAGGGAKNPALMAELTERLSAPVRTADALDLSADGLEAQAFAYLAVRSLKGLPLTFPGTTGIAAPLTGGVLSRP